MEIAPLAAHPEIIAAAAQPPACRARP